MFDLLDPVMVLHRVNTAFTGGEAVGAARPATYRRMGAHPLRGRGLLQSLHPLPEGQRLLGVVTGLGHHEQADVIRFRLLQAAHGSGEEHVEQRAAEQLAQYGATPKGRQQDGAVEQYVDADLPREPLSYVLGQVVRDFVPQYRRDTILVAGDGDDARVDKDLAAGENESIGLPCAARQLSGGRRGLKGGWQPTRVVNNPDLPVGVAHAAHGDQSFHHPLDHDGAPVPVAQEAAALLFDLVLDPLDLLGADALDHGVAVAVEAPPPAYGDRLDVAEVEGGRAQDGDDDDGVRARRPDEAPQTLSRKERLCIAQLLLVVTAVVVAT